MIQAISPYSQKQNINFGMAKYTSQGLALANSLGDVYEPLSHPNEFYHTNPDFFKKTGIGKNPFLKYLTKKLPKKYEYKPDDSDVAEVKETIYQYGASPSAHLNAMFIKQLIKSNSYIKKLDEPARLNIAQAVEFVLQRNWNNPLLTKEETKQLIEMASDAMEDSAYVAMIGANEKSNIK